MGALLFSLSLYKAFYSVLGIREGHLTIFGKKKKVPQNLWDTLVLHSM